MEDDRKICRPNGKKFYNAETLEETRYQPLFDVFRNKGIDCRTVQRRRRYVETVYAQSIDGLICYHVLYQSIMRETIGMRSIDITSAIADKLLTTVNSRIKIAALARLKWATLYV